MKNPSKRLSAVFIFALFITILMGGIESGTVSVLSAHASPPPSAAPVKRDLRFSIMDIHIESWKRMDKGVLIRMSPAATAAFYRYTLTHTNQAFDLYINDLFVISIMNSNPVKSGGLFIGVKKDAQDNVVSFLPVRKQKFD